MQRLFNKICSLGVVVGLIATLIIATSGVAFASDPSNIASTNVTMNVMGASEGVTIAAPTTLDFGTAHLTGSTQTIARPAANAFNLSVADLTGLNAGWSVTLAATTFTGTANASHVLPATALTVTGVYPFLVSGVQATNGNPVNSVYTTMPIQVTAGGTAAELYNADVNSGMGSTTLVTNLALAIPASTFADTYTSTLTITLGDHLTA